jgi:hypothetical protein
MSLKNAILIIGVLFICSCGKKEKEYALELVPQGTFSFEKDTTSVLTENYPRYYGSDSTLIWVDRLARKISFYKPQKHGYGFDLTQTVMLADTPLGLISDIFYLNADSLFIYYHTTSHEEKLSLFNTNGKLIRKINYAPSLKRFGKLTFGKTVVPAVSLESGHFHKISYKDGILYAHFHNGLRYLAQKQSIYGGINLKKKDTIDWFPVYYPDEFMNVNNRLQMHRCGYYHIHSNIVGDSLLISYAHTGKIDVFDRKSKVKIGTYHAPSRAARFPNDTIDINANPALKGNEATAVSGMYNYLYYDQYRNVFYREVFSPRAYDPNKKQIKRDAAPILQILDRKLNVIGEQKFEGGKLFITPKGVHVLNGEATAQANIGNYGKQKYIFSTYKLVSK